MDGGEIIIHTDGASRGNPGAAAIAYVIEFPGATTSSPIEFFEAIGTTTNNQAEYRALLSALERLTGEKPERQTIRCYADSELMVKQLNGEYRVKDALLRPHYEAIQSLVRSLEQGANKVEFIAVRRAENKRADYLANCALDGTTP